MIVAMTDSSFFCHRPCCSQASRYLSWPIQPRPTPGFGIRPILPFACTWSLSFAIHPGQMPTSCISYCRGAVIKWCMAIAGARFRIVNVTFPKCSMKVRSLSFFSCGILTRATNVRWCGRLVANYVPKWVAKVSNESTELRGSRVNQ